MKLLMAGEAGAWPFGSRPSDLSAFLHVRGPREVGRPTRWGKPSQHGSTGWGTHALVDSRWAHDWEVLNL